MLEKSIRKKLIVFMLIFIIMTGDIANVSINAKDDVKENLRNTSSHIEYVGGTAVRMSSTAAFRMGSGTTAATYYDPYVTAYVSGDFTAVDPTTIEYYFDSDEAEAISSAVISFLAPQYYMTETVSCHHRAQKGDDEEEWDTTAHNQ